MTVEELVALLQRFPPETEVEFQSTDAPEYGWLEVGGTDDGYGRRGTHLISNDGLEERGGRA